MKRATGWQTRVAKKVGSSRSLFLRRDSDLTVLIYLLGNKKLSALDPASWQGSNNSRYLTLC
jgi:hypothetical protein